MKTKIDKSHNDPLCRMCKKADETINHVVSECSKLAQKEYKRRHDNVARALHWDLCKKYGFQHHEKWYKHEPVDVLENNEIKLLWDFPIQTDRKLEHNRPDITIVFKKKRECQLIYCMPT